MPNQEQTDYEYDRIIPQNLQEHPLTKLSPQDEKLFQDWIKATAWYQEFVRDYGEIPDINTRGYDYRGAWKAGIRPERNPSDQNRYHWSDFGGNQRMKSLYHPAAWAQYFMDQFHINPDDLPENDPRIVNYRNAFQRKYPPRR